MTTRVCGRLVVAGLVGVVGIASSCRAVGPPAPPPTVAAPQSTDTFNDGASLYALEVPLTDEAGRTTTLADLSGQVLVVSMVYASCTSVCPRVTEDMRAIERRLSPDAVRETRFVLLSLDPARDTPEAWRAFSLQHQLDRSRWRTLSPTVDGVRDLAAVLGVKYAPEANGEIAHSAVILVLDRLGVVVHRHAGLGQPLDGLVAAVGRAQG